MAAEYAHRPRAAINIDALTDETCSFHFCLAITKFVEETARAINSRTLSTEKWTLARVAPEPSLCQVVHAFDVAVRVDNSIILVPVPGENHVEISP